ncbi:MAG: hypothetical protein IPK67_12015 [Planctomycetes bacterium]|nr:hypothetical protein [Planctomycetota bacterium]
MARFTDPAWTPVFPRSGGIVTEVGGWLSHAAILAREHGITAIVGTEGALQALRDGDLVRLGEDGGVEVFAERRLEARSAAAIPVRIGRVEALPGGADGSPAAATGTGAEPQTECPLIEGLLSDVSRTGGRLSLAASSLTVGERLSIRGRDGSLMAEALVVRNGVPGLYGIAFERPLEVETG